MPKVKLARADEIPEGGMMARSHGGRSVLLAKVDGEIFAIDNVCNHQGADLCEGELGEEGKFLVTCPWHAAHFDVRDGRVHQDTNWAEDNAAFEVSVEDGEVYVEM